MSSCVCSGVRSCLLCENQKSFIDHKNYTNYRNYIYCHKCGDKAFVRQFIDHSLHSLDSMIGSDRNDNHFIRIDGIFIKEEVINESEELDLVKKIDSIDWISSQSGRRKQDFGPKINFKKHKIKTKEFLGLPQFDLQLFNKIKTQLSDQQKNVLNEFIAVEVCHLEYCPQNGSSIDPHFDDFWLWGQRLVTINLLSATVLTLMLPESQQTCSQTEPNVQIEVDLPQRALVVLSGDSRYKYQHSIQRQHIHSRRIAVTFRELSHHFLPNGTLYHNFGKDIIERSVNELIF